jgi:hypothetical protein
MEDRYQEPRHQIMLDVTGMSNRVWVLCVL